MAAKTNRRKARMYLLSTQTIHQLDTLAALYGGHQVAVEGAIDATYRAAGVALRKMKVKVALHRGTRR